MSGAAGATDQSQVQPAGGAAAPPPGNQQQGGAAPPPAPSPPAPPKQQASAPAGSTSGGEAPPPDSAEPNFDKNDMLHLPKREFLRKAEKMSRKLLRSVGLPTDPKELKNLKEQWDEWHQKEEERRVADMSEKEKLAHERDAERARADEALKRMERAKEKVRLLKLEKQMSGIAEQHIDPKMLDAAVDKFARYLKENPRKARRISKGGDAAIAQWFQDLASKNTKYAREGAPPPADPHAQLRPPITNGTPPPKVERQPAKGLDSNGLYKGKDPRPGRHNSMTNDEARDYARSMGLPWHTP